MSFHKAPVFLILLVVGVMLVVPVSAVTVTLNPYEDSDVGPYNVSGESFDTLVTGVGNSTNFIRTGKQLSAVIQQPNTDANLFKTVLRGLMSFNLSTVPSDMAITSAELSLFSNFVCNTYAQDQGLTITNATPASWLLHTYADGNTTKNYILTDNMTVASFTVGSWHTFTLNADGIAYLEANKGTNATLAFRIVTDVNGVFTGVGALNGKSFVKAESTNNASYKPILNITYGGTDAPVADFVNKTSWIAQSPLAFSDNSTNYPTAWNWSFGDGDYSESEDPTHTYTTAGEMMVTLNASNSYGYNITSKNITLGLPEPTPTFTRYGTVLSATEAWEESNVFEPTVIYEGDPQILTDYTYVYKLWFTGGWDTSGIGYAESPNGINWTKYGSNPVMVGSSRRGTIWKENSIYYAYNSIDDDHTRLYNSSNGVTWTIDTLTVLDHGAEGTWDDSKIANTYVWNASGVWNMLYEGKGSVWAIGLATSDDGRVWTKNASNPVISGAGSFGGPSNISYNNSVYSVILHRSPTGVLPTDIYKYDSLDLINWAPSPVDAILTRSGADEGGGTSIGQVADPFVVPRTGTTYLYYIGSSNGTASTGNMHIKLATTNGTDPSDAVIPVASFTTNTSSGILPLGVAFTDTSTNTPTDWDWYINDVKFSDLQNPEYIFTEAGVYDVSLYAANGASGDWENKTDYITVTNWYDLQCQNQTGNITLALFFNSTTSLGWTWDDPVNITKISEDGMYVLAFDNSSDYFIGTDYIPETWHNLKIYNTTDYGQLNCTTDAVVLTPTPIPIMPSTESNVNPVNLFQYWPYALLVLGLVVVFKKW